MGWMNKLLPSCTLLLLYLIQPAKPIELPHAFPSFQATISTTYQSAGVDCDTSDCTTSTNITYHQMVNHTLEQDLRLAFDAKKQRMRIDVLRGGKVVQALIMHTVKWHGSGVYLNASTVEDGCTTAWKMVWLPVFPTSIADLLYFGGLDDTPTYTQTRKNLAPFQFYGIQLDTFDGTDDGPGKGPWSPGTLAGTWESEDNIGNFGSFVGTVKSIYNGPCAGLPLYTEVGDSTNDPSGRRPMGGLFATATFTNQTIGAGPEEAFLVPAPCWA